ncbi:MAG: DNA polymerase I [Treponema sp. CETP13]|nr:MAG: DNA polymerase I [Treponema sp. CETP13]
MTNSNEKKTDNTLYILDSYGLIYRAYFAFINRPLINDKGENVSAIFGFFRNFYNILRDYNPQCIVAAFDSRTPTFRHEMYKEYKANRAKTPEDLHEQVPIIEKILSTLGIPVIRKDGFEADDVIATIAERAHNEGRPVRILSGDKDLMQLVNETTIMLKPDKTAGWTAIDYNSVIEEWGVEPLKMLDMLALQGDSADNIPGVKGCGKKTAQKLITQYGDLDGIYAHADEIKGAMGNKIRNDKENAYFSRSLVQLRHDVPVETDCTNFYITPNYKKASELLKEAGVPAVAKQYASYTVNNTTTKDNTTPSLKAETKDIPDWATDSTSQKVIANPSLQNYQLITTIDELSSYITKVLDNGICAFDTETDSLTALNSHIAGFSLSMQAGTGIYIPLQVTDTLLADTLIKKDDAFTQLARIFGNPNMRIIMHNGKYDLKVLYANGLWNHIVNIQKNKQSELNTNSTFFVPAQIIDTMVAAWLIQPDRNKFSLESLCESKIGLKGTEFSDIVPKKGTFMDVPLDTAFKYAAEDADFTFQLWEYYEPILKTAKLEKLFYNLEMPVLPILTKMEIEGIQILSKELDEYSDELAEELDNLEKKIYKEVGHEFNISSPKQLQTVLFEERGLKTGKKTKTGYSTDTSVLENLALYDVVPQMILSYRGKAKLKSTYVDTLPLLADRKGRIHTSFVQTGAATGRLSSRDPNLQNIPVREESGRRIRKAFVAPEGRFLVSADYSQIELVLLAHLSKDKNLCNAFNTGTDVHKSTAALIFEHENLDEVTADERRAAKTINFGVMYGMSAFRLSNSLGIPRTQAQEFINQYFSTYSGVRQFMNEIAESARNTGFVSTIMGRKRIITGINSKNKMVQAGAERVAINTPIQGSAADIVKQSMIDVDAALLTSFPSARILLQVHDELIIECDQQDAVAVSALLKKTMENVIKLIVPLRVSVESGKRWGEFH